MECKVRENMTIVLPIEERDYDKFMACAVEARRVINHHYGLNPDIFPSGMSSGWKLNGKDRKSKKTGYLLRRIKAEGRVYRIRPCFLLSYHRGKVSDAWRGLFLLRFGVPFWALAFVFGKYPMWWYRLFVSLGRNSIVGTTVRKPEDLPRDLLADEHHIRQAGDKAYVATTVGGGCFLGMAASHKADAENLESAYGEFKAEALELDSDYQPVSVNTDGWAATQNAWKTLFSAITVIECFLHAFLKVRDRATKKMQAFFDVAADKIWDCYRAEDKRSLAQQIRRLKEWAEKNVDKCAMKDNILKLCKKKDRWMRHFDCTSAHRTSNMVDRLMRAMKKHAYNSQMFHSRNINKTTDNFRAFALLYNFAPSCPAVWKNDHSLKSPAARLNKFTYHENWLCNLQISASLGGFRQQRKTL